VSNSVAPGYPGSAATPPPYTRAALGTRWLQNPPPAGHRGRGSHRCMRASCRCRSSWEAQQELEARNAFLVQPLRDRFLAGAEPRRRVRQINRRRMGSVVLAIYVGAAWATGSVRCIEEFGLGVDTFPVVVGKPPGVARSCGSDLIAVQADVRFDRSDELVPRISTVPGLAECHHPSLPRRKRGVRFLQEVGDVWKFGWIGTRWIAVGIRAWAVGEIFTP